MRVVGKLANSLFIMIFSVALVFSFDLGATPCSENKRIPGQFIIRSLVRTNEINTTAAFKASAADANYRVISSYSPHEIGKGFQKSSDEKIETAVATLTPDDYQLLVRQPETLSIENDCLAKLFVTPNDPLSSQNLGLGLIRASQGWDIRHDTNVVVAISDTGVDISHPDLVDNLWTNSAELNGSPGIDDDHNGFVDDIHGWGFPENNADVTPGSYDGSEHGTHIAGIVAAKGNNGVGVSGVAWSAQLMSLRSFKKSTEEAALSDLIASVYYAVNNGAQIINCSWGLEQSPTQAELDAYAFAEARGVLVVAAAGNESKSADGYTPASIPTVLTVGSINSQKELSTFTNFGRSVAMLAPGGDVLSPYGFGLDERIFSTVPNNKYDSLRGTSISTPFVSGAAALVKSLLPKITPANLRLLLKEGGDLITVRSGGVLYSYANLNLQKTLSLAQQAATRNPACTDNCILAGAGDFSSVAPNTFAKFGGGGCSLWAQEKTKGASSAWDLAFLFSSFVGSLVGFIQRRRKK